MSRWIRMQADIFSHPMFAASELSEREAWLWLVAHAAWRDTKHRVGNEMMVVERGSLFVTLRELQVAWRWGSDARVRNFLKMLENERMICRDANAGKTQVTICNYSKYQDAERAENEPKTHAERTPNASETHAERTKDTSIPDIPSYEDTIPLRSDAAAEAKAPEKPILAKPKSPKPEQEKFEEFWQAYPKRDGSNPKEPARQKFEQAVKRGEDPEAIISAAKRYAEQQKRLGNIGTPYVKQATSWLNAKCWLDDYGTAALVAASQDANAKAREFIGRLSASQIESYVQRYFVGQFQWNSGQLGPPPDRPGTLIPPDLINRVKQKQEQAA